MRLYFETTLERNDKPVAMTSEDIARFAWMSGLTEFPTDYNEDKIRELAECLPTVCGEIDMTVARLVRANNRCAAVKKYRNSVGTSLYNSVRAVGEMFETAWTNSDYDFVDVDGKLFF